MAHELRDDAFLEKVIITLVIIIGAAIIFNQFQFVKLLSSILLNFISFLLIFALVGLVAWLLLLQKKGLQEKHHHMVRHSEHESKKMPFTPFTFHEKLSWGFIALIAALILFNQFQISQANTLVNGASSTASTVGSFVKSVSSVPVKLAGSGKGGVVIGPQINSDGRTTKLVEWHTISDTPAPKSTGNPTQDAIAAVVPTGTPFYVLEGPGSEKIKGASFDDPITSQKVWASLLGSRRFGTSNAIQLTEEEQKRWERIVSVFTCDYCCGGPTSVTTINSCGCAHSYGWQGMSKFFIKYYPNYSDEQIMGEMTKWKAIWYPQGMLQDYLVYTGQQPATILTHGGSVGIRQQFLQQAPNGQQQTQATATPIEDLPSMVGGC